ncbi:hypothetical protein REPUB_Repub13aG0085900 [Reevesia pubescens]
MHPPIYEIMLLTAFMPRRIAIHPCKGYVWLKGEHPNLRSLLLFQDEKWIMLDIPTCNNFKFVRVLNLVERRYANKWHVSSEIGNLNHLRYLGLKCSGDIILPRSIRRLKSLHTLNVRSGGVIRIPNVLFKLDCLRHVLLRNLYLISRSRTEEVELCLPAGDTLKNVETLKYIRIKNFIESTATLSLTNIKSLGIVFERSKDVMPFLKSLIKLHSLRSLYMSLEEIVILHADLEPLSQFHHLSKLGLSGKIQEDLQLSHHVLKFLPENVAKLTLMETEMKQDPMAVLEKLPHLRILRLWYNSYRGTKLICSANGFLQLDSLFIEGLSVLEEWEIEEGAMPRLRTLHLEDVPNLRMLPEGLRYITSLQEMRLVGIKMSLLKRIEVTIDGREGDDFSKVRQIPSLQIIDPLLI